MPSIRESFNKYFEIVPAITEDLRKLGFQIRYQVYCEELGFENKADFPDGYEIDEYDHRSYLCLLRHKESQKYVGTVRLVTSNLSSHRHELPFERYCTVDRNIVDMDSLPPRSYGEISRLAVISAFRRRAGESTTPYPTVPESIESQPSSQLDRRSIPHIALGLYLAAAAVGLNLGMERAFAMMEPSLARRLKAFGIHFEQIGAAVEHRGLRGPFQITRESLEKHLSSEIHELLTDITKGVEEFTHISPELDQNEKRSSL
ncbi:PEP-CTERM/exosortase system-associated acyltransferase [Methylococcus sp. EFPC2]|uniref:PEP-CTERM/exosortase system-associated acyltransferase n=1 Tax=Methylococcus sp. EFPC2 TaxID=2812648 RepID=UPI0019680B31|nr:PEP-CTERM/exosortase system-associated acyltransferase [Methylococcus sp. EFPC2]QSA95687.1 PEP-CTERM/exosortase system-associated acyltransferase [Methylococcus sp. EFPC2]